MPTLLDACNVALPRDVKTDGRSFLPLVEGKSFDWPERTLFVHHQGRFGQKITDDRPIKGKDFAVMTDRWRLVNGEELFDDAIEAGISIAPGHIFSPCACYRNFIRLSFGHPWSEATENAMRWLGNRVTELSAA